MTRIHNIHREEQMSAYRRDFLMEWKPFRLEQERQGQSKKVMALAELHAWQSWLREHRQVPDYSTT